MSEDAQSVTPPEPKLLGVLAQFPDADDLVAAARKTTDEGYRKVEGYSPFPLHGIDDALRAPKTILPWLVFCGGVTGCLVALALQYYVNGVEFPFIYSGYAFPISAKPIFSLPANIPVTFELIILFSSLTSFFGMIALNGLPRYHNPLFRSDAFSRVTNDGFFLTVDAKDARFEEGATTEWLKSIGATHTEPVYEVAEGRQVPAFLLSIGAIGAAIALVPPLWVAASAGTSTTPRFSIWWDMDYQPKYKAQAASDLFADDRAMRTAPVGTVARGSLQEDQRYYEGVEPDGVASAPDAPFRFASAQVEGEDGGEPAEGAEQEEAPPEPNWTADFPLDVTEELMHRGQQRFNIYCATCHGKAGYGEGLISLRALQLQSPTWVKPLSLHDKSVREQPVGRIFNTITNGIRKMPGYRQQISPEDRWAIVLYVRALQKSQNASLDEIPDDMRPTR